MVKKIILNASSRKDTKKKAKQLRNEGMVPAVLYGQGVKTSMLEIKKIEFDKIFEFSGFSNLIDLSIDKKEPIKSLVKDIQEDPVKGSVIHVDLVTVDMKKKIEVEIPLNFIGDSPAVKELGGTLIKSIENLPVRCLPSDIVEHLDVDISVLKTFEDNIHVSDVKLPENYEVTGDLNDQVAGVLEPRTIEEDEEVQPEGEEGDVETEGEDGEVKEGGVETEEKSGDKKEEEKK
jgi:large subunit ribosomal protein L25